MSQANALVLKLHRKTQVEVDFYRFLFPNEDLFVEQDNSTFEKYSLEPTATVAPTSFSQSSIETTNKASNNSSLVNFSKIYYQEVYAPQDYKNEEILNRDLFDLAQLYDLDKNKRDITYPIIKINPSQIVNTDIPPDLNICTDQLSTNNNGNTYCIDISKNKRPVYEIDCVFPFQYKGVWYDTCTDTDSPQFWCSIEPIFTNKYAFCKEECPELARNLLKDEDKSLTHTSCMPRNGQAVSYFPDQDQINKIIDQHNAIRSAVNSGADLLSLDWDFNLARLAQRKSDTCTFSHDCSKCRVPLNNKTMFVGQNAYTSTGYSEIIWPDVISLWASEKASFKYGGPQTGTVNHYTQIVSNRAAKVGCGASKCGINFYVYCNYASGQIDVNRPYNTGTSCSACPGFCSNNLCKCSKYCQNGGTLDLKTCTCICPRYTEGDECEKSICAGDDKSYGCWATDSSYCKYPNIPPLCPTLCKLCKAT